MTPNEALQALLSSFPRPDASDPALAATAYVFAIDGISAAAVVNAVKRFIRGEVPGHDPRFCPTPAQLAIEARRIEAEAAWKAEKAALALLPPPPPEPVLTAEEKRANRLRIRALADRLLGRESAGDVLPYRVEVDALMGERRQVAIEATA
jgi:hypothetical protein